MPGTFPGGQLFSKFGHHGYGRAGEKGHNEGKE